MKYLKLQSLLALCLIVMFPCWVKAEDGKTYTLAIIPQLPPLEIYTRWTPFVEKLSEKLKVTIRLLTYPSIPQFEADLLKGVPDFVFMNPYQATIMKNTHGYIPLVRDRTPLIGILVTKKDSGFDSVQKLNGKEIAFPSPNAFAASLYMRALLREKEKISFTPVYVKTHSNVYRHVVLGKAAAGGGVNNTLMRETDDLRKQLKIIYVAPGSAPHPLSAHPRVPEALRKEVVNAVLKLAGDKNNKKMFDTIQIPEPVKAEYGRDYLPLEKLGLEKYIVTESE